MMLPAARSRARSAQENRPIARGTHPFVPIAGWPFTNHDSSTVQKTPTASAIGTTAIESARRAVVTAMTPTSTRPMHDTIHFAGW